MLEDRFHRVFFIIIRFSVIDTPNQTCNSDSMACRQRLWTNMHSISAQVIPVAFDFSRSPKQLVLIRADLCNTRIPITFPLQPVVEESWAFHIKHFIRHCEWIRYLVPDMLGIAPNNVVVIGPILLNKHMLYTCAVSQEPPLCNASDIIIDTIHCIHIFNSFYIIAKWYCHEDNSFCSE